MPDLADPIRAREHTDRVEISSLGRDVLLVAWDVSQAARFSSPHFATDNRAIAPLASLRLTRTDGGARLLWALKRPNDGDLEAVLSAGPLYPSTNILIEAQEIITAADAETLLDGITRSGRIALVSALFNVWSAMFRLRRSRTFIQILHEVLAQISADPGPAIVSAQATGDLVLLQTSLSESFGKIDAVYALGDEGPVRVACAPYLINSQRDARDLVHILTQNTAIPSEDGLIVLVGPRGLSVRKVRRPGRASPPIDRWLREHAKNAPGLREHLLLEIANHSPAGRALAVEVQLRAPLKARRALSHETAPSAEIVSAISTPAGTLVTGWYRDPVHLFAGIDALGPADRIQDLSADLRRFPVDVAGPTKGSKVPATGFAVLAAAPVGSAPLLQPRFRLRLKSGATHALVPPLQPADPVEARAAALRAVPAQHVDDGLLTKVLAPVIADLHEQARTRIGRPSVKEIGSPIAKPRVSVIVPLYKALDFLRFQIAAFAMDSWFRSNAEVIYVLDSPEQARDVEHLLRGFHLVYDLPMTLVIMERNGGYARANNVGATYARGDVLALVNSDVIPIEPGWLEVLLARLNGRRRIGAVGPKLLFEDGSIQHAGMYFSKDHHGRWLNQHYHKGMPRDYERASEERLVPAVTGACLVTPRAVFEAVGGFTEDYVVGDYEDSDLCLKITMTDRKIAYAPDVELYHLERKSMSLNAEYMRGIAWQYNCALHTERWGDLMTSIMQSGRQRKTRNASI